MQRYQADDATRKREFGNLRAIRDNYPKYVISMNPLVSRQDSDGIIHLHLRPQGEKQSKKTHVKYLNINGKVSKHKWQSMFR